MTPQSKAPTPSTDSYSEIPYPRYSFPETHPARLAAVSHFFGVEAPPIKGARILEIGCAVGGNALALAAALPGSHVVAIDKSRSQIEYAQSLAKEAGLQNISFECRDIGDAAPSMGTFDYCIAHGVLSWMDASLQPVLLQRIDALLNPSGIAYVSFNTLPGWFARQAVRDLMRFHTRHAENLATQLSQARNILSLAAESVQHLNTAYSKLIQEELHFVQAQPDGYIAHDHLEQNNNPLYFSDFLRLVSSTSLRYLSDVSFPTMWPAEFPAAAQSKLTALAKSGIELEQYLDFIRNRTFRQSLLVKASPAGSRTLSPKVLSEISLAFPLWRMRTLEDGTTCFRDDTGTELRVPEPHIAALLSILAAHWPSHVPFPMLVKQARETVSPTIMKDHNLEELLLQCLMRGLLIAHYDSVMSLGGTPKALRISRLCLTEARRDGLVANLLLHRFRLTPRMRAFFVLLDGAPTMQELQNSLETRVAKEKAKHPDLNAGFAELLSDREKLIPKGVEFLSRNAFLLPS